nr:hypothetical protein [uncultured Rhodopila sp.]
MSDLTIPNPPPTNDEIRLITEAAESMRDALDNLIVAAEQTAADEGEDDLIDATPQYDAARKAIVAWDELNV